MLWFDGITGPGRSARRFPSPVALTRVIARLTRARTQSNARLRHWPTWGQVRAMAFCDGREPCSYLLDPVRNFVPELPVGDDRLLGTQALCFTCSCHGRLMELVTLRHGGAFDLLGL